ncbi:MAG: 5-formyltetrahydrofolate cyclo-ligase [Firmicutes bacterium]|nr:5-formyltetrahydrofolate cyclo-ligase [Bacillota bacterium]
MGSLRETMGRDWIEAASRRIAERFTALPEYDKARTVMLFASFRNEVETAGLIRDALGRGKTVAVPVTNLKGKRIEVYTIEDPDSLQPGTFNVPEPPADRRDPLDPRSIDLVAVPGLAFDRRGFRVGFGLGLYDRFLPLLLPEALTVGLAFSFQVLAEIPATPQDVPVRVIVTENYTLRFS